MANRLHIFIFALITAMTFISYSAMAEEESEKPDCDAYVVDVAGNAEFTSNPDEDWAALTTNQCVYPGDLIRTGEDGAVSLQLGPEVSVKVNANSDFQLWNEDEDSDLPNELDFELGEVLTEIAPEEGEEVPFAVNTPSGVVSVKGTEFHVMVDEEGKSEVKVLDGVVELLNDLGSVLAEAGMAADLLQGMAPGEPFGFDVDAFRSELDEWAGLLKGGNLKKFIKEKVKDEVKKKALKGMF